MFCFEGMHLFWYLFLFWYVRVCVCDIFCLMLEVLVATFDFFIGANNCFVFELLLYRLDIDCIIGLSVFYFVC